MIWLSVIMIAAAVFCISVCVKPFQKENKIGWLILYLLAFAFTVGAVINFETYLNNRNENTISEGPVPGNRCVRVTGTIWKKNMDHTIVVRINEDDYSISVPQGKFEKLKYNDSISCLMYLNSDGSISGVAYMPENEK